MAKSVIEKRADRLMYIGIISTVIFLVGAVLFVLGLSGGLDWRFWAGLAMAFIMFFVMPISWTMWGERKKYARMAKIIMSREETAIDFLAAEIHKDLSTTIRWVNECLENAWLPGYYLRGNIICKTSSIDHEQIVYYYECEYCGGDFDWRGRSQPICPYCDKAVMSKPREKQ